MSELFIDIALRLAKVVLALIIALVVWLVATGPAGAPASPELAILCWLSGAAAVLLVESNLL